MLLLILYLELKIFRVSLTSPKFMKPLMFKFLELRLKKSWLVSLRSSTQKISRLLLNCWDGSEKRDCRSRPVWERERSIILFYEFGGDLPRSEGVFYYGLSERSSFGLRFLAGGASSLAATLQVLDNSRILLTNWLQSGLVFLWGSVQLLKVWPISSSTSFFSCASGRHPRYVFPKSGMSDSTSASSSGSVLWLRQLLTQYALSRINRSSCLFWSSSNKEIPREECDKSNSPYPERFNNQAKREHSRRFSRRMPAAVRTTLPDWVTVRIR